MPRRNIAMKRAAVCDRPEIAANSTNGFRDYAASDILRLQQQSRSVAMASFPLVSATGMLGSGFRAESQGLHFKLAVIHSELSRDVVHRHLRDGRARALPPSAPLSDTDIDAATHIVGIMGSNRSKRR